MQNEQIQYKNAIGTVGSPVTLTDDETDNTKTLLAKFLRGLHLNVNYTPKTGQTDRYLMIAIDLSDDDGTTFHRITTKANTTTEIMFYEGAGGIWAHFPGNETTTGGTEYIGALDLDIIAEKLKISVKESGSGNYGTAQVGVTLVT